MIPTLKQHATWVLLLVLLSGSEPAKAQSYGAVFKTLDLRTYGWEPPESREIGSPSIAVDHRGRIVVGFTVRERTGLVTRTKPSLNLHIIRFSSEGNAERSLSLPTNSKGRSGIYLSDTDQIIVRANESVQILQANKGNPQRESWETLASCTRECNIEQSVSRRTMLLYTDDGNPATLIRFSNEVELQRCGKQPQLARSFEEKIQNYPQCITDEFSYFAGSEPGRGQFAYRWPHCNFGDRVNMALHVGGRWSVLNDKVSVVDTHSEHGGGNLEVLSFDGQVKFRPELGKYESASSFWAPVASTERGDRIAVDILTARGGNRTLDVSSHVTSRRIAVYDIESRREVASIPVSEKFHYRYDFALSPDGKRLAIVEDEVVKVVDLLSVGDKI